MKGWAGGSPRSLAAPTFLCPWAALVNQDKLPRGAGGLKFFPLTTDTQFLLHCQETIQGKEGEAHGSDDSMPQK